MLTVDQLSKRYGTLQAVDKLSFSVNDGECFGLLGPNGAGKTTTISMIAGITPPDAGVVTLDGASSTTDMVKVKEGIGFVPQEIALYKEIDARENLRFFGALYGLYGKSLDAKIAQVLELVGLSDRAKEPVGNFSGGMKRRLNIAAGLLHDPKLLIFDEPTAGVDPQSRNAIFETLESLRREGKTILYTTHYMEEVERLCQRVAIMDHGQIVASGELNELKSSEGNRSELVVDLSEPLSDEAGSKFKEGFDAEVFGARLMVKISDLPRDVPRVLLALEGAGATVLALKSSEATLEQVFLRTTGRNLRD